jgi:hypothetical protein
MTPTQLNRMRGDRHEVRSSKMSLIKFMNTRPVFIILQGGILYGTYDEP